MAIASGAGCGPASRRDLSTIPQRQISFDDECNLQAYFDQRNNSGARPFRVLDETQNTTEVAVPDDNGEVRARRVEVGSGEYEVSDRPARRRLQQLIDEQYVRVPDVGISQRGAHIRLKVRWWLSNSVRRLMPTDNVEIVGPRGTATLPFNPCVGEFLFGAEVYAMRRRFIDDTNARASGRTTPSELRVLQGETSDGGDASSSSDASAASVPSDGGG
ncbi:MAG: hypothetical protein JNK05_02730 [Myxococcales bacterium]|nr:hypothetical protein [Myxococcales bacterium]